MNVRITAMAMAAAAVALGTPCRRRTSRRNSSSAARLPNRFRISARSTSRRPNASPRQCEKLAAAENVAISIYVLDNDGNHVYMDRMDGQGYLNIITAEMKARTALAQRAPSKVVMNQVRRDPNTELQRIPARAVRELRRSPVVINHQMIGVIGIGGSAPRVPVWSDEICGHKAMQQVLGANNVAPLVEDVPNPPNAPPANAAPGSSVCHHRDAEDERVEPGVGSWRQGRLERVRRQSDLPRGGQEDREGVPRLRGGKNGSMSLYVLDTFGELVHMERMDGQVFNNIRTALMKAQTSLQTRVPTSVYNAQGRNNPAGANRTIVQYDFFTNSGGIRSSSTAR
jgi:uncharacterized protein GlcG (DUF336 family)